MKVFFILFISLFVFSSCKPLSDLTEINSEQLSISVEKDLISSKDQDFIKTINASNLNTIIIPEDKSHLIDQIMSDKSGDTLNLSNLFIQTLKQGKSISYEYDVKEGDVLNYSFLNNKSGKIEEILIYEGDKIRFAHNNLKRNKSIDGSFQIIQDNKIILKITNYGFFKSNLSVKLDNISKNFRTENLLDSIVGKEIITQKITDTIFMVDPNKIFSLPPYLDITNKPELSIPINIENIENTIGWGYWISLNQDELNSFNRAIEDGDEDPLLVYAKSEIFKNNFDFYLPITNSPYVELKLQSNYDLKSSLNSERNFDFFVYDFSEFDEIPEFFLNFKNYSKLYDYKVTFKLVRAIKIDKLVEKEIDIVKNYIKIIKNN
tara:strand:- start:33900 stop:35030 length:1131 start_codon:yes stop_codon:yes gene_type:complete